MVFLEDSVTRNARQRFNFALTPAFPIPQPEATRIQMRQELWLHKHTTSAIKERVRIPAHSLGLVVKVKENDTAIVEVAGLGQVELRVQDLTHVSLVITEVGCFKFLGLQLDYTLHMEEATKTGVANIRFAHSKVSATLHSLNQLPKREPMRHYHLLCVSRCGDRVFSRKHGKISGTYAQKVKSNSGKQFFLSP